MSMPLIHYATPATEPINPAAFIFALVTAPLATALPGLVLLVTIGTLKLNVGLLILLGYVPAGAVIVGGLPYLLIGIPGLIYALRTHGRGAPFGRFAFLGHICSLPVVMAGLLLLGASNALEAVLSYGMLAAAFAPTWGVLFAWLYFAIVDRGGVTNV